MNIYNAFKWKLLSLNIPLSIIQVLHPFPCCIVNTHFHLLAQLGSSFDGCCFVAILNAALSHQRLLDDAQFIESAG